MLREPELELLRELLIEDPAAEPFLDVAREYVRRQRWNDALAILEPALELRPTEEEGWELLIKASVEAGEFLRAILAFDKLSFTPRHHPELAVLQIRALLGLGHREQAVAIADILRMVHPKFPSLDALFQVRRSANLLELCGPDPFATPARAEQFIAIGHIDRALRIYRKLSFHFPDHVGIHQRLKELEAIDELKRDDLSEELPAPEALSQGFSKMNDEEDITHPAIDVAALRRHLAEINRPLPGLEDVLSVLEEENKPKIPKLTVKPSRLATVDLDEDIQEARRRK